MVKISLITACYNNAGTIEHTIQSVLNQSHKNIEYLIIDGASTDGTLDIIAKYKSQISKIVSEPDKGIYDALNKGIQLATGDVIGFLHADDHFYSNQVVALIVDTFGQKKVEVVYGNLQYISNDNAGKVIRNWVSCEFDPSLLSKGWMPPHPTLYVKKEVYQTYGTFNTIFHIAADYDFMLRIFKGGVRSAYVPEYIVQMRVGGKSNSFKNLINKMKEDAKALRKNKVGGIYSLFLKNITKVPQFFK